MHLIQKYSSEGIGSLSNAEIDALMRELMFTPTNFSHLLPILQGELSARRMATSSKRSWYLSILALIVSIISLVHGFMSK
jgi:hypothetical protein